MQSARPKAPLSKGFHRRRVEPLIVGRFQNPDAGHETTRWVDRELESAAPRYSMGGSRQRVLRLHRVEKIVANGAQQGCLFAVELEVEWNLDLIEGVRLDPPLMKCPDCYLIENLVTAGMNDRYLADLTKSFSNFLLSPP